jgi:hypothetical protein
MKHAFSRSFSELEQRVKDNACHSVIEYEVGHSSMRTGCTSIQSTRAYTKSRNLCGTIPTGGVQDNAHAHHEYDCTLKQIEKKSVEQSAIHNIMQGELMKCQTPRHPQERGVLLCDATSDHPYEYFLHRDLNASINNRECVCCCQSVYQLCFLHIFHEIDSCSVWAFR